MLKNNRNIVLILDNIRSCHNVGSLFRTAEGLGVSKIYLCGITPYPKIANDSRLPHLISKITNRIDKTALGSIDLINYEYSEATLSIINKLRKKGFKIISLEQSPRSKYLDHTNIGAKKVALVVGNEVSGVDLKVLDQSDLIIEIKMLGKKESLNVVQATAMALYHLTFN